MNWQHIEAMLKCTGWIRSATVDGRMILTNDHFMLPVDGHFEVEPEIDGSFEVEDYKPLESLWSKHSAFAAAALPAGPVGMLALDGDIHIRNVGGEWINEAYFRCFDGPEVCWALGPGVKNQEGAHPLFVLTGTPWQLAAVVMPMRRLNKGPAEPITDPVSDEVIFSRFSSEHNDWYLAPVKAIDQEIADLEASVDDNDDRINSLEQENHAFRRQLDKMRELRGARIRPVEPAPSEAKIS